MGRNVLHITATQEIRSSNYIAMNFLNSGMADSTKDAQKFAQTNHKSLVWDCESSLYDSFELQSLIFQLNKALQEVSSSTPNRFPGPASGWIRSFSTPKTARPRFVTDPMLCNVHNTGMAEKAARWSDLNKGGILSQSVKKLLMRVFHRKKHRGQGSATRGLCRCHQAEVQSNFVLQKSRSERMRSQAFGGLHRKK